MALAPAPARGDSTSSALPARRSCCDLPRIGRFGAFDSKGWATPCANIAEGIAWWSNARAPLQREQSSPCTPSMIPANLMAAPTGFEPPRCTTRRISRMQPSASFANRFVSPQWDHRQMNHIKAAPATLSPADPRHTGNPQTTTACPCWKWCFATASLNWNHGSRRSRHPMFRKVLARELPAIQRPPPGDGDPPASRDSHPRTSRLSLAASRNTHAPKTCHRAPPAPAHTLTPRCTIHAGTAPWT